MSHRCAAMLILALSLVSSARAQHAEGDEVEVMKPPEVKPAPDEKKPDLAAVARSIIEKTDSFRKDEGRSAVKANDKLVAAAAYFAGYMARTDRYGHTADGQRPADRAKKHGYDYCIVLENIAYEYNSAGFETAALAEGFFQGWKKSPPHRRNMLDADVTETGVAVARSEATGYYYAVQVFGRPKSRAIRFEVANECGTAFEYEIGGRTFSLSPRYTRTHSRCRPAPVLFRLPGDKKKTVKPVDGDRFAVVEGDGAYRLKAETRRTPR